MRVLQILFFILFFYLGGCVAKTPINQLTQAKLQLTTLSETVLAAHQSGAISDERLVEMDKPMQTGFRAVAVAERLLEQNGGKSNPSFQDWLDIAYDVIATMMALEKENARGPSDNISRNQSPWFLNDHDFRKRRDRQSSWRFVSRTIGGDRRCIRGKPKQMERYRCRGSTKNRAA